MLSMCTEQGLSKWFYMELKVCHHKTLPTTSRTTRSSIHATKNNLLALLEMKRQILYSPFSKGSHKVLPGVQILKWRVNLRQSVLPPRQEKSWGPEKAANGEEFMEKMTSELQPCPLGKRGRKSITRGENSVSGSRGAKWMAVVSVNPHTGGCPGLGLALVPLPLQVTILS